MDEVQNSQDSLESGSLQGSPSGSTSTIGFPMSPILGGSFNTTDSESSASSSASDDALPLPSFTAVVKKSLRDGDSTTVWNLAIEQMMHFYVANYSDRYKSL
jgi:hypothetical protein